MEPVVVFLLNIREESTNIASHWITIICGVELLTITQRGEIVSMVSFYASMSLIIISIYMVRLFRILLFLLMELSGNYPVSASVSVSVVPL